MISRALINPPFDFFPDITVISSDNKMIIDSECRRQGRWRFSHNGVSLLIQCCSLDIINIKRLTYRHHTDVRIPIIHYNLEVVSSNRLKSLIVSNNVCIIKSVEPLYVKQFVYARNRIPGIYCRLWILHNDPIHRKIAVYVRRRSTPA